jgi:hypothetical protein
MPEGLRFLVELGIPFIPSEAQRSRTVRPLGDSAA